MDPSLCMGGWSMELFGCHSVLRAERWNGFFRGLTNWQFLSISFDPMTSVKVREWAIASSLIRNARFPALLTLMLVSRTLVPLA